MPTSIRRPTNPTPRQGGIYFLQDCPPLDTDQVKGRPVIVVDDAATLRAGGPVVVVACSSTIAESETDRIRLPSRSDTPGCRTGLDKPCWAVPRWFVVVEPDRLANSRHLGYIAGAKLIEVVCAVQRRITAENH
ncbi:MAG: type II toxin-antitoxin system PemK/MazF family toxin [Tepidisphaerales bacterium]